MGKPWTLAHGIVDPEIKIKKKKKEGRGPGGWRQHV